MNYLAMCYDFLFCVHLLAPQEGQHLFIEASRFVCLLHDGTSLSLSLFD